MRWRVCVGRRGGQGGKGGHEPLFIYIANIMSLMGEAISATPSGRRHQLGGGCRRDDMTVHFDGDHIQWIRDIIPVEMYPKQPARQPARQAYNIDSMSNGSRKEDLPLDRKCAR